MGAGYSDQNKEDFKQCTILINRAVEDSDAYLEFRVVRDILAKQIIERKELVQ